MSNQQNGNVPNADTANRFLRKKYYHKSNYKSKRYEKDKSESNCPFGCCKKESVGDFLLQKGYLDGFCSDIVVKAFDKEYRLHKLLLSRSGYFRTLFFGSWSDCDSNFHELIFDDIDYVTRESFELAIASLYGGVNKTVEKKLAANMISTGQFLDIPEIICVATDNIINDLNFNTISKYTNFAYHQNLGAPSERILESARALLCIDGWEQGIIKWDGIPTEIITDVVGSDSFFVTTEWDRCIFIIKLIERRIIPNSPPESLLSGLSTRASRLRNVKSMYGNLGKTEPSSRPIRSASFSFNKTVSVLDEGSPEAVKEEDSEELFAEEVDGEGDSFAVQSETETTEMSSCNDEAYIQEQIKALKECLCSKVHFCHLSFEQLQLLETLKDCNGEPFVSSSFLRDALWAQSSMHRLIISSKKNDPELNVIQHSEAPPSDDLNSWYKVPVKDETIYGAPKYLEKVMEANQSLVKNVDDAESSLLQFNDDEDDEEDETDSTKDSDNSLTSARPREIETKTSTQFLENFLKKHSTKKNEPKKVYKWAKFPPFRFSIAFTDISSLDTEKRVYGKVLWYAGCYWNLYVQKIQKHKRYQLGVYLHRASNSGQPKNGFINRDIYQDLDLVNGFNGPASDFEEQNTITIGEEDYLPTSMVSIGLTNENEEVVNFTGPLPELTSESTENLTVGSEMDEMFNQASDDSKIIPESITGVDSILQKYDRENDNSFLAYEDKRQQISVYFIIRTPSRKSKSNLTCFTSSPSLFSTSQSWGWKSNSMCSFNEDGSLVPGQNKYLKFMVVLGNT